MPAALPTGLVADALFKAHDTGIGHPERPERFDAVMNALATAGLLPRLQKIPVREITTEELLRCHTGDYVQTVQRDIARGADQLSTGDTTLSARSHEVASAAAGGALNAVDAVMTGEVRNAFCVLRPPGHHATPGQGMGFCIWNNAALAARHAQQQHGARRALIIDWDVHHGNGTQDIFYADDSVLFFSIHQWPWYPGTGSSSERGTRAGEGCTINCPLPAGSGHDEVLEAFEEHLLPAAAEFKPDVVILSAGFDSRRDDPLGQLRLEDADFAELTRMIKRIADDSAEGRLISVLEGGYNLAGLGSAAAAHLRALMED